MTSSQASAAGWYSDPTGIHQLRYFDTRWTDFVLNNGVQSVSPMPPAPYWKPAPPLTSPGSVRPVGHGYAPNAPDPYHRNSKKVAWIVTGIATAGLAVIAIGVAVSSSGGSASSSGGDLSSFCRDFNRSWAGPIVKGEIIVTVFVDTIENDPTTFSGGNAQERNSVTVASQDAGALAKEAPGSLKDVLTGISVKTEITRLHTFLLAGVKMAHGDASAAAPVKNFDDTFMGSIDAMGISRCPQH